MRASTKELITVRQYCELVGEELTDYWYRRLGEEALRLYHQAYGQDKSPPKISRRGYKSKGYHPVDHQDILDRALNKIKGYLIALL